MEKNYEERIPSVFSTREDGNLNRPRLFGLKIIRRDEFRRAHFRTNAYAYIIRNAQLLQEKNTALFFEHSRLGRSFFIISSVFNSYNILITKFLTIE